MFRLSCVARSLAAVTLAAGFAAPVFAQEIKLRAATFLPPNQSFGTVMKRWVDAANQRGKGIMQIDLVGPEAVPTPEQPNAVKAGVIDLHFGPPTFYRGTLIEAEVMSLADLSAAEMKKNGSWDYLNKLHAEKMNVMLLTYMGDGVNFHIYTTKPALSSKDKPFDGFTLRAQPIYKAFFESIGAKTAMIVPGEVYTALERNMVQGYGWPLWGIKDLGWLKHTKYRYDPGFFNVAMSIMVNLDRYKKLDAKQQAFLNEMGTFADTEWPKWRKEAEGIEAAIQKDGGVQVVDLGPGLRKQAHDAFWAELEKASPTHVPALKKLVTR
ncbi:MAG: TRAP transporter substrate-binding protein DctP [Burkholderiales bacterium]